MLAKPGPPLKKKFIERAGLAVNARLERISDVFPIAKKAEGDVDDLALIERARRHESTSAWTRGEISGGAAARQPLIIEEHHLAILRT